MPNWVARSARQPGWRRDSMSSWRRSGSSSPVSRSICRSPVSTACRPAGDRSTCATAARPSARGHAADRRDALVEQGGGDPLMPGAALIQQVLVQPDDSARLQHVARRDPALGQVPGQQVHPQVPGVGLVGLGVPLAAAQRGGIGRLGQVRLDPGSEPVPRPRTASRCSPPARNARRRWPANRASHSRRCSRSAGTTRPRFSSPVTVSRYSKVSCRRCTSNAPTMLMRDLLELLPKLGHGTCSLSPHVVDTATTDAGEVPPHMASLGPSPPRAAGEPMQIRTYRGVRRRHTGRHRMGQNRQARDAAVCPSRTVVRAACRWTSDIPLLKLDFPPSAWVGRRGREAKARASPRLTDAYGRAAGY